MHIPRLLTLTVLVTTIDAQWEGMGGCRVGEVRAGTTSPMPDRKGFKLQQQVNFQKFSTLRVKPERITMSHEMCMCFMYLYSQPNITVSQFIGPLVILMVSTANEIHIFICNVYGQKYTCIWGI